MEREGRGRPFGVVYPVRYMEGLGEGQGGVGGGTGEGRGWTGRGRSCLHIPWPTCASHVSSVIGRTLGII